MVKTRNFPPVAIVAGVRTPFARSFGSLQSASADELGTVCLRELVQRSGIKVTDVDEVIVGCVGQPADAMNIARVIALRAGFPVTVSACTVHRNCASSFESITTAWERIATGQAEVVVAGGAESMSNMPVMADDRYVRFLTKVNGAKTRWSAFKALFGFRPSMLAVRPALRDGLTDKTCGLIMGMTAENLARDFRIARDDQDRYALESHRRLTRAWADNRLCEEVMPVYPGRKCEPLTQDVGYRPNQTMDALAKLRPFFDKKYGSVTVGNSCPITDGAVMLLMMPLERAKAEGREVLGVLESFAYAGLSPDRMGLGPVFSSSVALADAGMTLADMDLVELNEAFAAQVIACLRAFESDTFCRERLGRDKAMGSIDPTRLNVNGGAIAMGHPVGATGARLVLTLLREMQTRNLERGLATLCIGGGMGGALVLTRDTDTSRPKRFPTASELAPVPVEQPVEKVEPAPAEPAAEPEAVQKPEPEPDVQEAPPATAAVVDEAATAQQASEPPADETVEPQPEPTVAEVPSEADEPDETAEATDHSQSESAESEPETASEAPEPADQTDAATDGLEAEAPSENEDDTPTASADVASEPPAESTASDEPDEPGEPVTDEPAATDDTAPAEENEQEPAVASAEGTTDEPATTEAADQPETVASGNDNDSPADSPTETPADDDSSDQPATPPDDDSSATPAEESSEPADDAPESSGDDEPATSTSDDEPDDTPGDDDKQGDKRD